MEVCGREQLGILSRWDWQGGLWASRGVQSLFRHCDWIFFCSGGWERAGGDNSEESSNDHITKALVVINNQKTLVVLNH